MVYEVPKSKASIKQNRFEFRLPGSKKVHSIPKMQYLSPALQRRFTEVVAAIPEGAEPSQDQMIAFSQLQLDIFDHYVPGVVEALEGNDQVVDIMEAWQAESNISLGESSASAAS